MSMTTPAAISTPAATDNAAVPETTNLHEQGTAPPSDATTKLTEAIDDFLGDLETKFKGISDEILTKLDDMAERCDRLEAELLMREAIAADIPTKTAGGNGEGQDAT